MVFHNSTMCLSITFQIYFMDYNDHNVLLSLSPHGMNNENYNIGAYLN